ncbi:hypothetical protein [Bordetella trematum]|uniref:hypothetical protein n=1 Tax=Bordetella trematum TaxID=123899 RepID=UPI00163C5B39|nr:hypothetical protein [Bordetella trematum]
MGQIIKWAINPALALLPPGMDTPAARVMLLSIGLHESRFLHRRQLGNGPARGLWYCEHARPVWFDSAEQVDLTPGPVRRQIFEGNETWARICAE